MKELPNSSSKRRDRQIFDLAEYVVTHPGSSNSEVMVGAAAIGPTCRTSYFLYLTEAIANGWLLKTGETNGTRYFATPQFRHHVAMSQLNKPIAKRTKVTYDEEFLASYVPNQSQYLTKEQLTSLHKSCAIGSFNSGDPTVAKDIRRFMADFTHNSSAFEGVDIKYADTIGFLEENIESRNMSALDAVILRNHYNAIRFIIENTHYPHVPGDVVVSEYDCRNIHSQLSDGLLADRRMQGKLRHTSVEIRDSCYIPTGQPDIIKKEFAMMFAKAEMIRDPYEQALFLLVHLPYLQPFEDCNKRTSRLVCSIPLLSNGILPVSWAEVAPRDYTNSLLCIYEQKSTYGIADVFVEACKRSFERFEISMKNRQPTRLEVTHAKQIGEAIRNRIMHDDPTLPREVGPMQVTAFEVLVEDILSSIRENDMVAAPYRIKPGAVAEWIERETQEASVATDVPK
jgi:Fic family protein